MELNFLEVGLEDRFHVQYNVRIFLSFFFFPLMLLDM